MRKKYLFSLLLFFITFLYIFIYFMHKYNLFFILNFSSNLIFYLINCLLQFSTVVMLNLFLTESLFFSPPKIGKMLWAI